jgi:hypothetical protein
VLLARNHCMQPMPPPVVKFAYANSPPVWCAADAGCYTTLSTACRPRWPQPVYECTDLTAEKSKLHKITAAAPGNYRSTGLLF